MKLGVILAALAGLAVTMWLVFNIGLAAVSNAIAAVGFGGFGLLCVFALATFVVLGAAWFALMPSAPFWSFVWGRIVRDAAGEVLPFSQLGGILVGVRALILRGIAAPAAFASSIVDVTTEMMAQIVFILIGVVLFAAHSGSALPAATISGIVFVLAGSVAFIVLQRRGLMIAEKLAERFIPALARQTREFHAAVMDIHERPSHLAASSAIHLAGWIASALGTWLTIRLIGGNIDIGSAVAVESILCALRSAAVVVPGALGVQEAGYALLLPLFGLPPEMGLAVSLLKRGREIVIGVPVLLMWQGLEGRRVLAAPEI
jgi:putative membrane protein